ncbi:MAG: hypothetical protein IAG10_29125 [Planctomycetaceae bacterium]|nr:hypothetical protein [Planctomycetaceae bacterium]
MTSAERNRQAAILIWSSLLVVTVLLLSRRVAVGIAVVASAWPSVLVSLLATMLSGLGWVSFQQQSACRSHRAEQIAAVIAWLPTWLSGLALLPADSPLARGWLFGIAALSAAGFALGLTSPTRQRGSASDAPSLARRASMVADSPVAVARTPTSDRPDVGVRATQAAAPSDLSVFDPVTEERSDESTTQWMTRQSLPDGVDQIEGAIRVSFAAGQRAASVHVPFSPPFAAVPQVECEAIGDDPARWKVSVVYAYGMRVELKRESSDEPAEIELSYSAVCDSSVTEAA